MLRREISSCNVTDQTLTDARETLALQPLALTQRRLTIGSYLRSAPVKAAAVASTPIT